MSRLVIVGQHYNAQAPFLPLFKKSVLIGRGDKVELAKGDVVLFGGGEDISPTLYKQKPSRYSGSTKQLSQRDSFEQAVFEQAKLLDIPMIGICRGAQLICALSGGSLYQHVNNHAGRDHLMTTKDGDTIKVCSVHHQMMNPMGSEHEVLAWATEVLSNVHLIEEEKNLEVEIEPEVVYFKETKALAIQYHPEFMNDDEAAVGYARALVNTYILKE